MPMDFSDGVVTRGCAQHSVKLSKESYVSTWMGDSLGNTWLWRGSPKVSSCTLKAILAKCHLACRHQQYATPTHTHLLRVGNTSFLK